MLMKTTVLTDRVLIGPTEYVPRFLDLPKVLVVPEGTTHELEADSTWDYVEVGGTLRVDRTRDTRLAFTHLLVLPGGHFDCGIDDENDPIPAGVTVNLIVRDVPIDTTRDPFQWGNGLINFGRQDRCGAPKMEWTTLAVGVPKGATEVVLADNPDGWEVGDEILISDTSRAGIRRESPALVKAIKGRNITLSKPLDFEHLEQWTPPTTDQDGKTIADPTICGYPYIANLTRNVNLTSENPNGTRGHTANIGPDSMWCICYNRFSGLGRTRGEKLDNTSPDGVSHIGTNQIAKYTDHAHHAMGYDAVSKMQSKYIGNVRIGAGPDTPIAKWGLSIHMTHDALIERDVFVGFYGAGCVTEDGGEVRNVFRRNLAMYCIGNHPGRGVPDAHSNVSLDVEGVNVNPAGGNNNPGAAGDGFWFRGIMNTFDSNVAVNNSIGINLFNVFTVPGSYPSEPGGDIDTVFRPQDSLPILYADNVTNSNINIGTEVWGVGMFPQERIQSIENGGSGIWVVASDNLRPVFHDPLVVGAIHGITSGQAYSDYLEIVGGSFRGCDIGIADGGGKHVILRNVTFQNEINLDFASQSLEHGDLAISALYDHVMHLPLPGKSKQYLRFGTDKFWDGVSPLPEVGTSSWMWQVGSQHIVKNWQGTGQDYQLFEPQSLASKPAWPSGPGENRYNCPEAGITMGQSWEKYGIAWNGEALDDADAEPLDGLIFGLSRKGSTPKLGPPRAPVTYPTPRAAAVVGDYQGPYVEIIMLLTGKSDGVADDPMASVDGGDPMLVWQPGDRPLTRRFFSRGAATGTHGVTTWRTTAKGVKIPESEMTFQYQVGEVTLALVPNVVGSQADKAAADLKAAGFVVGTLTTQVSTLTSGQVLSQMPTAGSRAAAGTAVALVLAVAPPPPPPPAALLPPGTYRLTNAAGKSVDFVVEAPMDM